MIPGSWLKVLDINSTQKPILIPAVPSLSRYGSSLCGRTEVVVLGFRFSTFRSYKRFLKAEVASLSLSGSPRPVECTVITSIWVKRAAKLNRFRLFGVREPNSDARLLSSSSYVNPEWKRICGSLSSSNEFVSVLPGDRSLHECYITFSDRWIKY